MQVTPELASIVLAFAGDWVVYRLLSGERLTLNRLMSAMLGGAASFIASIILSPLRALWTPDTTFFVGIVLLIAAWSKGKRSK